MEFIVKIGNWEIFIPETITSLFVVIILLTIFSLYVNSKVKKAEADGVPSNFLNVIEMAVEAIDGLVESTMGPNNMKFAPFIFSLMIFISTANLVGLIGLTPPTSDLSVTLTLALNTFFMVQIISIKTNGGLGYIKTFLEPYVLLSPLNIIGELANPVSLSFRLFGNILSSGLIMTLFYGAFGLIAPFIAAPFHAYFDLFAGLLQAFIFTMLTMVFVAGATE